MDEVKSYTTRYVTHIVEITLFNDRELIERVVSLCKETLKNDSLPAKVKRFRLGAEIQSFLEEEILEPYQEKLDLNNGQDGLVLALLAGGFHALKIQDLVKTLLLKVEEGAYNSILYPEK